MIVLTGSQALKYNIGNYNFPDKLKDTDIIGTYEDIQDFIKNIKKSGAKVLAQFPINSGKTIYVKTDKGIIEAEVAWHDSPAEEFINFLQETKSSGSLNADYSVHSSINVLIPNLNVLYLLKMSHRYLKNSPHFLKTMRHIQLMRKNGAIIELEHKAFYKRRMETTYDYSHPKLNVDKGEFFNNETTGVVQIYDHDLVHRLVKHLEFPAYEYFKQDKAEVMCSKELFDRQPIEVKLYSVLEEAYVLAVERSLSVYPDAKTPKEAFDIALMKVCTSITSGWWREFAWEHYDLVQDMFEPDFYDKFKEKL